VARWVQPHRTAALPLDVVGGRCWSHCLVHCDCVLDPGRWRDLDAAPQNRSTDCLSSWTPGGVGLVELE
jgi:hypothetical protein